ncbi:hypothetical protein L9G15_11895 [Shewanella sp. A3A]|nr:hypothetical protein [Shewanella ferrihydritica]
MKITIFINDGHEFRMRVQKVNKTRHNSYKTLSTVNLVNVSREYIYSFMINAGFNKVVAQNFKNRLIRRFEFDSIKLGVSDCGKYIFYLCEKYGLVFFDKKVYACAVSFKLNIDSKARTKFSKKSHFFNYDAYELGNRNIRSVISIPYDYDRKVES